MVHGISDRGQGISTRDPGCSGALGDEERQEPERLGLAAGLAPTTRSRGRRRRTRRASPAAQRALVALEGGERDAALMRLVSVVDEEARHAMRVLSNARPDIRGAPRSGTLISRAALGYARLRTMALLAEQLVGRAAEVETLDSALAELQRGRPAALELVGEPGIGKTRLLAELGRPRGRARLPRALRQRLRARERPAVLGVRRRARRLRPGARAARARRARRRRARRARPRAAVARAAAGERAGRALPHRTARCASCSRRSRRASRWCCMLDDLHWADSGSIDLLGIAAAPPAGRAGAARARACGRGRCPSGCRPRSSGRTAPAR